MAIRNQAEEAFTRMNRFFKLLVVVDIATIVLCRVGIVSWGLGLPIAFGAIFAMFAGFVFTMHKLTKGERRLHCRKEVPQGERSATTGNEALRGNELRSVDERTRHAGFVLVGEAAGESQWEMENDHSVLTGLG